MLFIHLSPYYYQLPLCASACKLIANKELSNQLLENINYCNNQLACEATYTREF